MRVLSVVLFIVMALVPPLAVANPNDNGKELYPVLNNKNLSETLDAVYSDFGLDVQGDTFTVVEGCASNVWVISLIDVNDSNRIGCLYYIPDKSQYFVLDVTLKLDDPNKSEMLLHKQGSGVALHVSDDKIEAIRLHPGQKVALGEKLAPGTVDNWTACVLKILGVTSIDSSSIVSLLCTGKDSVDKTIAIISLAKNCISIDPSSWLVGAAGLGKMIACGELDCEPPPTGVSASDGTYTDKVYITWSSVSDTTSYNIYRATSSTGTKSKIGSSSWTTTAYSDTSAAAGTTYYYWVTAVSKVGESRYSSSDSGYKKVSPPSAPTGVSASDGTYTTKVYITWNSVSVAASYNIYRATSSTGTKSKIGSSTVTNYSDTSATAGTTYYYWVTTVNSAAVESGYSSYDSGYRHK